MKGAVAGAAAAGVEVGHRDAHYILPRVLASLTDLNDASRIEKMELLQIYIREKLSWA